MSTTLWFGYQLLGDGALNYQLFHQNLALGTMIVLNNQLDQV